MSSGQGWIVARTKTGRENWAAENVQKQGYQYYYPRTLVYRKQAAIAEPLFRNYMFVKTTGAWKFLLSTFGIVNVVTFGESPAFLSQFEIDKLKNKEVDGLVQLDKLIEDKPRFTPGQEVRIKGGVFSGYRGIYEGLDVKERERILMDFLGRKIPLLLAPELVEAF